jgi:hypothetical protein
LLVGCGGQTVEPLDVQDVSLPIESRRYLADAEDGVIVARARLASVTRKLEDLSTWQDRIDDEVEFSAGGPTDALSALAAARVRLGELDVAWADASLDLAEAKLTLATAEQAVLHDLAIYELDPLRIASQEARDRAQRAGGAVQEQQRTVDDLTNRFWAAYAEYAQRGGETRSMWIGSLEPIAVQGGASPPASPPAASPPAPSVPPTAAPVAAPSTPPPAAAPAASDRPRR